MKPRLEYFPRAPELMQAVLALNKAVEESGLTQPSASAQLARFADQPLFLLRGHACP